MMQITEDTPPDMLAGAMDLILHLPGQRNAKLAVERSTPMMDLLVQITTAHQLQISNYTLQALEMAPSSDHRDKILPYKPNTPIGALNTQHIKVVPKTRTIPVPKNVPPGHQPFESTFRLKVHLPRNQLYVVRVSRNIILEEIMKKVCEEKNLDPIKYEFKHPGNLDETLDPKLTLSDYQITEIYIVAKGTISLSQTFSTSDIMAFRKEEERKQLHNKTGGGVFNLIFRRGKSSMGSGSISSDTRSISPTHSDCSRSVTPPGVAQKSIFPPPKEEAPTERPKPPLRKRRLAPKPPQQISLMEDNRRNSSNVEIETESNLPSIEDIQRVSKVKPQNNASEEGVIEAIKSEGALVISHSRTSSDSSGYHEASVLSENCNMSLPRRPKSAFVGSRDREKLSNMHSQSSSNLSQMASHSKSTVSLGITGRKKKAPPPPPPFRAISQKNIESASPVVASQSANKTAVHSTPLDNLVAQPATKPLPRSKNRAPQISPTVQDRPIPRPRSQIITSNKIETVEEVGEERKVALSNEISTVNYKVEENVPYMSEKIGKDVADEEKNVKNYRNDSKVLPVEALIKNINKLDDNNNVKTELEEKGKEIDASKLAYLKILELQKHSNQSIFSSSEFKPKVDINVTTEETKQVDVEKTNINQEIKKIEVTQQEDKGKTDIIYAKESVSAGRKLPEVVGVIPRTPKDKFDSYGRKKFQNSSLAEFFEDGSAKTDTLSTRTSVASALDTFNFIDEFSDLDDKVFSGSIPSKKFSLKEEIFNELYGIHSLENVKVEKNQSISSLRSLKSLPGFLSNGGGMKKFNNSEALDDDSLAFQDPNSRWVIGESDSESITSFQALDHLDSANHRSDNKEIPQPFGSTDSGIAQETNEKLSETEDCRLFPPPPPLPLDDPPLDQQLKNEVLVLERPEKREEEIQIKSTPVSEEVKSKPSRQVVENTAPKELYNDTNEIFITSPDLCDINWQYQLPSPPKAFRDYSESVDSESQSVTNFKESDSLKKRKSIEDIRSLDTFDAQSGTFIADEPPLNNLSLENLEKRKSLVYNRELSTSLKISDEIRMDPSMKFESTIVEVQKPSYKGISTPKNNQPHTTNTLPNFKISTYDRPKEKIKVFEDDTIRSSENGFKNVKKTYVEGYTSNRVYSHLNRFSLASSMDNVSLRRNSIDDKTGEKQYSFYRHDHFPDTKKDETAFKSECSNNENTLSPGKSVSRSRSHLTLDGNNKHKKEKQNNGKKGIERSNSLYDMSGLQSLGVMRLIQSKLNIPTSLENLIYVQEKTKNPKDILTQQTENPHRVNAQKTTAIENVYKYQGPPSINMSTWSERLKVPVSVKEDEDYTLGNSISYKLIVNTTNNSITSNNSIEIKNSSGDELNISENKGENVKIDGTALHPKIIDNQRFISHTTPTGYRKPFTDIDKYKRPHSETNVSRVPVVRSVELKKPYKDFENISVTQINTQQNSVVDEKKSFSNFGHFKPSIAPTVRGFKPLPKDKEAFATNTHVPFSQITLRRTSSRNLYDEIKETKAKQPENEVEHSKNNIEHPKNEVIPPIPPVIPKENFRKPVRRQIEPIVDTRDQLLEAIRSFGGKKGLKPANM